jgi:hypothetical protein
MKALNINLLDANVHELSMAISSLNAKLGQAATCCTPAATKHCPTVKE